MNNLKQVILLFIITAFVLTGCQNQKNNVKNTHKIAIDKWQGLANYAKSYLNNYPVYFAATFSLEEHENRRKVVINDFQITNKVSLTQLDLLNPSFKDKLICDPSCSFFNEYIIENKQIKNTMASDFFNEYEFKLFDFYSQLFLLNDRITLLEQLDKKHLSLYFQSIVAQKNKYSSLDELAIYLQDELTQEKYRSFFNDPRSIIALNVQQSANEATMFEAAIPEGSMLEDDFWSEEEPQEILLWASDIPPSLNSIKAGTLEDFEIGDTVCTPYNSLGIIVQVMGSQVVIDEIALAQVITDGISLAAPEVFLRFKDENFNFISIDNKKVSLPIADVFSCEIQ